MNNLKISVVIPVRDEEKSIGNLLDSLLSQTTPPDEIVIVDAGSVDGTRTIVADYASRNESIRLIPSYPVHPGEARNTGVRQARHDILAFTDAGIRLEPHWLEKLSEPLARDPSIDVVYGTYEPLTDSFFKECAALTYVPALTRSNGAVFRGPSIASSLMRKSVWKAVGGFPPYRASEDLIFMEAIERNGFKIAYAPEAVAHWQMASDWKGTFKRFTVYSYHNLLARRGRYWHKGVLRQYLLALVFLALAFFHHSLWLSVPVAGFVARVGRTLWRKRKSFRIPHPLHPRRWVTVGLILLLIDAATFSGAVAYFLGGGRKKIRA